MKTKTKIIVLLLITIALFSLAACGANDQPPAVQDRPPAYASDNGTDSNESDATDSDALPITMDRAGNPITIPENIDSILSMGPAVTEVLVALGFADAIIATDSHSGDIDGIDLSIAVFDMQSPDVEQMLVLQPDVIIASTIIMGGGDDPLRLVSEMGVSVIYVPTSETIEAIEENIMFLAAVLDAVQAGEDIVSNMRREIDEIRSIGETITDRRSVYFEINPAPFMFSFGRGVFLNEMIEIIGAVNVFEEYEGWISVADEDILQVDPEVILTNVSFIENPIDEIKSRPGWYGVDAVINGEVHFIDTNASSRQTHNIITALLQMARAIYPEYFN